MTLTVTNYGAACCVIEGNGLRILCDPWFTDGIYLGAWEREHYLADPITTIGSVDYIWISHLHEDHYDPVFLRAYKAAYPAATIVIGMHKNYLAPLLDRDGFAFRAADDLMHESGVSFYIMRNQGYPNDIDNIDTALVVTNRDSAVVNMNDNPFDQHQVDAINRLTAGKHIIALLPYSGAGPWPQCIHMSSHACLMAAADKRRKFINQFSRYKDALHADVAIPFAAGYRLRGKLADLNPYRGIPKPEDVPGGTVLPVTGAMERPEGDAVRYAWEDAPIPTNEELERLLQQAAERSPKVDGDPLTIYLSWGTGAAYVDATPAPAVKAHETIELDPRLLHGLLTRRYHWNTAEIGSVLRINRHKDYDPRVFDFLYRFHV